MGGVLDLPGDPDGRPGTIPPGSGGNPGGNPGPPGGFGGGTGGLGGYATMPGGYGLTLLAGLKKRTGANPLAELMNGPDSVPAMLQPGEFVVNRGAAQQPDIAALLSALNQITAMPPGMAGGGFVPGFAGGGMVPQMGMMGRAKMAMPAPMPMPMPMPMQQMGAAPAMHAGRHESHYGGRVPGGRGWVQSPYMPRVPFQRPMPTMPIRGGMAAPMPMQGPMLPMPVQHFAQGGFVNNDLFGGTYDPNAGAGFQMPKAEPILSYADWLWKTYKKGAFNIEKDKNGFNARYRPEYDQYVARMNANNAGADNPMMKAMYALLGQYGGQGYFGPEGSPAMMSSLNESAKRNADALNRRTAIGSQLYGMDPGQAGAMQMQSMIQGNRDYSNFMGNARLGQLQNQQQFGQNLFGNAMGFNQNLVGGANNFANQSNQNATNYAYQRALQNSQNGWGQQLGGFLGSAAGSFMGGGFGGRS